jgi:hypothetical protein
MIPPRSHYTDFRARGTRSADPWGDADVGLITRPKRSPAGARRNSQTIGLLSKLTRDGAGGSNLPPIKARKPPARRTPARRAPPAPARAGRQSRIR